MMSGLEKSDLVIVATKLANKAERPSVEQSARGLTQRSWWSEGRGPRGTRASKARTGHRDGSA